VVTFQQTTGFSAVFSQLSAHEKSLQMSRLSDAAVHGAELAREFIEDEMGQPKGGIFWNRPDLPNTSSSPSEFPAEQTGALVDSLEVVRLASYPGVGRAALQTNIAMDGARHGWLMEFGFTTSDGGFHIRPWMRPIIDMNSKRLNEEMQIYIRGATSSMARPQLLMSRG